MLYRTQLRLLNSEYFKRIYRLVRSKLQGRSGADTYDRRLEELIVGRNRHFLTSGDLSNTASPMRMIRFATRRSY
jgi:hypothetical protein